VTFGLVSVLVPTRKRPEQLRRMLKSFEATNDGCAELVFRIDDDDPESLDQLAGYRIVVGPRLEGYKSMPAFFNEMLQVARGDVLMCGNDDMVFKTPGWPTTVLELANHFPDGMFDIGVKTYNEDHYPFFTVSRAAAEALGFLLDPRLFWGDIFWRDVMGRFNRCVKLPAVEIEHNWMGHHPDTVFEEARQPEFLQRDPTYWSGTHIRSVEEAVEKLKSLIEVPS
jgi:hypothetical protein